MEDDKKRKTKKIILIVVALIIYTAIVVRITVMFYTKMINNALKNSFNDISIDSSYEIDGNKPNITKNNKEEVESMSVNYNDVISKDSKYEATIIGHSFSKKVLPPNTSGYYSYYEAKEDGHQYLEIKLNYKNLNDTSIDADDAASMRIKYNNKYEYTSFSIIEDSEGNFTYSSITPIAPLTTGKLHYLFDIPDEVANSTEPIVAYITIGKDNYELNVR